MIAQDVIRSLLRTEKGSLHEAKGKYLFLVANRANKVQVKRAVEEIYKVKVIDVNTFVSTGKLKRVRQALGRTSDKKKAIVTLAEGQKIDTV